MGRRIDFFFSLMFTRLLFRINGVVYGSHLKSKGVPMLDVAKAATMRVGDHFRMNNGQRYNMIGRQHRCSFFVTGAGSINIGNNVGVSSVSLVSLVGITIGNNVTIGGNTAIYDTDFHSIKAADRLNATTDKQNARAAPVNIGDNVFIGAHCTILKGVTIGKNAVVGACSVVTTSVPGNQLWAGNPARFVRNIDD